MDPPWITHPDIPEGSIGWRMGRGEDALTNFYRWFSDLAVSAREAYADSHPVPDGWTGFYDRIAASPWPNDP